MVSDTPKPVLMNLNHYLQLHASAACRCLCILSLLLLLLHPILADLNSDPSDSDSQSIYDSIRELLEQDPDETNSSLPLFPPQQDNSSTLTSPETSVEPVYVTTATVAPGEQCSNMEYESEVNQILIDQMLPSYNKQALPNNSNGVETRVEISINAIPHFSELDSFFELDLFFSELWHEPRLSFVHLPQAKCVTNVTLGLEYLQRVWTPNVCIVNSKAALIHSSPSENVFLILYQDGTLWKNCRMLVRGPCDIDLRLFPFDVQRCSLIFESYSFNSKKVTLQWIEGAAIRMTSSLELPDFVLTSYIANRSIMSYPNGQWDQLKATFVFERRYGFFIMQAYLPTYMTVFVAYINFWMDPKELATRSTLAISAFLAMCLQLGNVQQNQPRVSYVKAMDVWMLGSISFLFVALIELAIISYMMRADKHEHQKKRKRKTQRLVYLPSTNPLDDRLYQYEDNEPRVILAKNGSNQMRSSSICQGSDHASACMFHHHQNPPMCPRVVRRSWKRNRGDKHDQSHEEGVFLKPSVLIDTDQKRQKKRKMYQKYWRAFLKECCCTAYGVDRFFLCAYPPAYLMFNICYWTYYL